MNSTHRTTHQITCLLAALLCIGLHSPSHARDALALMQEVDQRLKAHDETVYYDMELYDGSQRTHVRKLLRSDKAMQNRNSTLVRFTAPDALRYVGILIEDSGRAINDIWSYTPSTKRLRRIAGAQKQSWFMGTEFSYEDFEDFKLKNYHFSEVALQTPCLSWARCSVIDALPKEGAEAAASGYSKKRYFIEDESQFPVQVEYFDNHGQIVKRLTTERLEQFAGYYRAAAQTMVNLENQRSTRLIATEVRINQGLPDARFSQRYLRSEDE